jgi:hypothetical protein
VLRHFFFFFFFRTQRLAYVKADTTAGAPAF